MVSKSYQQGFHYSPRPANDSFPKEEMNLKMELGHHTEEHKGEGTATKGSRGQKEDHHLELKDSVREEEQVQREQTEQQAEVDTMEVENKAKTNSKTSDNI